jgi:2-polyprenyl-3-methyl-5-hydroxy-6-metoxy-1,4-benzoquinol methylase
MSQTDTDDLLHSLASNGWEEISCPTCGTGEEGRLVFQRTDGHGIRQCQACGLMFVSPRLSPAGLAAIYEEENHERDTLLDNFSYEQWKRDPALTRRATTSYKVKAMLLDLVGQHLETGTRLLDVGCGFGLTVLEATKRGYLAEGVEISQRRLMLARERLGLTLMQGRLEELRLPAGSYDGVIFWDVLEHVHNPLEILAEIRRVTRPGGFIFGQVPNWRGLTNRYKTFLSRHGFSHKQFKHFGMPNHVFMFDARSLEGMLDKCGWRLVYCRSWSKLKYHQKVSAFQRCFYGILERRNLTDYIAFVAQNRP